MKSPEPASLSSSLSSLSWLTAMRCDSMSPDIISFPEDETDRIKSITPDNPKAYDIDYNADPRKPPFAYATLIYLALEQSDNEELTLSEIYDFIVSNFAYYRTTEDTGWRNSIRHNLSQDGAFLKSSKRTHGECKGGTWKLNPKYPNYDQLVQKKRRRFKNRSGAPLNGKPKGVRKHKKHPKRNPSSSHIPSQSPKLRKRTNMRECRTLPHSKPGSSLNHEAEMLSDIGRQLLSLTEPPSAVASSDPDYASSHTASHEADAMGTMQSSTGIASPPQHTSKASDLDDLALVGQRCTLFGANPDPMQLSLTETFLNTMDFEEDSKYTNLEDKMSFSPSASMLSWSRTPLSKPKRNDSELEIDLSDAAMPADWLV